MTGGVKQVTVVAQPAPRNGQGSEPTAFFDEAGEPIVFGGGGEAVTWATLTGKPATFAPTIGTTATTAKAGNYTLTAAEVGTALKAKTQVAALAAVSAANGAPAAADPVTKAEHDVLVTLANANKVAINAIIAALKA